MSYQLPLDYDLIVDNFAGGGGASTGIEMALERPVNIAINHDPEALCMHAVNHPLTRHYCDNVFAVDPVQLCSGRRVALAWFSPDCTHHSKAKGGKPRKKDIRGLAWVVTRWARTVRPRVIVVENVQEFQDWGPLTPDGHPCKDRKGQTFNFWVEKLRRYGYQVEWRELKACDYSAPTIRKRLFLIARCDGKPIVWPEPTHGPGLKPYRTAAECIDWSIPCPSIFERKRPLAENTLRRIAKGIRRFIIECPDPFIAPIEASARNDHSVLVSAFIAKHFGGVVGAPVQQPLPTILTRNTQNQLVSAYIMKMRGTNIGHRADEPQHTISAGGTHYAQVCAFLLKYYGSNVASSLNEPMHSVTAKDRFGLVTIHGQNYAIADIGMRMLTPAELYRAQGFPQGYIIDRRVNGMPITRTAQVRMCGNSVCPPVAAAIIRANVEKSVLYEAAS